MLFPAFLVNLILQEAFCRNYLVKLKTSYDDQGDVEESNESPPNYSVLKELKKKVLDKKTIDCILRTLLGENGYEQFLDHPSQQKETVISIFETIWTIESKNKEDQHKSLMKFYDTFSKLQRRGIMRCMFKEFLTPKDFNKFNKLPIKMKNKMLDNIVDSEVKGDTISSDYFIGGIFPGFSLGGLISGGIAGAVTGVGGYLQGLVPG